MSAPLHRGVSLAIGGVLAVVTLAGCGLVGPIMGDRFYSVSVQNPCPTLVEVKLYPNASPAAYTEWDWVWATPIPAGQAGSVDAGSAASTEFLSVRQLGGPWTTAGAVDEAQLRGTEPISIEPAACPGPPDPFDPSAIVARIPGLAGAESVEWYVDFASKPNFGEGGETDYYLHAVLDVSPEMIETLTADLAMEEVPGPPRVDDRLVARLPAGPFLRSGVVNGSLKPQGWIAELYFAPEQEVIVLILTSAPAY